MLKPVHMSMTLHEVTTRANALKKEVREMFDDAVKHYNTDSVKFSNEQLSPEAYLQELICLERAIVEAFKCHGQYMDIFEYWKASIANKEVVSGEIQDNSNQLIRFIGIVRNNIECLQEDIQLRQSIDTAIFPNEG